MFGCHCLLSVIVMFTFRVTFFRPEYLIIREIYETGGVEEFENELDQALEVQTETIVIEPVKLGAETARWIAVGNFLHKVSVLSGLSCLVTSIRTDRAYIILPLGITSFVCAGVYMVSWQYDPCCKYQVETDLRRLEKIPLHKLSSSSPVILVRKDDSRRKILHNTIALAAITLCCLKMYRWYS